MVNYCAVHGCGRNSRSSKHLYFYSVPKNINRQEQWLIAARREDLLEKPQEKRVLYRFCSRHFSLQSIKNKHLCADAVPTLHLPGCEVDAASDDEFRPVHSSIVCNNCRSNIAGFRYKCLTCVDFDLCSRCEMAEAHEQHLMLRIPNPIKFKKVEAIVKKWQMYYNEEQTEDSVHDSSDDEPIQKYARNQDNVIQLSEDMKEKIKAEVSRVLKLKSDTVKKLPVTKKTQSTSNISDKEPKVNFVDLSPFANTSTMAFADINEIHSVDSSQNVKSEVLSTFSNNTQAPEPDSGLLPENMSDLSGLIMESSNPAPQKYYFMAGIE